MSDTQTTAPARVERMTGSSRPAAGFGGILTGLLALACLALIITCFVVSGGKKDLQESIVSLQKKVDECVAALAAKDKELASRTNEMAKMRTQIDSSIPLTRLPSLVQASTVSEALNKIQRLANGERIIAGGSSNSSGAAQAGESPSAWLETIAKQVSRGTINTKESPGNDPSRVQLNKGIQIVLARIGSYSKTPTGSAKDTYDAVTSFQKANGLTVDGIIGKGTWGKVREKFETVAHVDTR